MSHFQLGVMERRRFLQFAGAAGTAAAMAGVLSACGGSSGGGGASTTRIEAGMSYTLSTGFDPMIATGALPQAANLHVFEALVDLDPVTREPYTALAAEMPEQVDDTTLRVTLREEAVFHNGDPVTTEDVVYSFERVLDPENNSLMAQFISFIEGVTEVDENTVEITLKHPFALANERLGVVKIVPKALVEEDAQAFDSAPVGSGPYRLVSATAADNITFAKWEAYNGPREAKAEEMVWLLLDDPSARVTALQSGRVSVIEDVPYLDAEGLAQTATVEQEQSFGLLFLMFNCSEAPFDDKRVRQALHYAIDHDKIIETAMMGGATAASGYLPQTHPDYQESGTVYRHDPDRAKELLEEAEVEDLEVTLVTTNTGWVRDVVPLIKESWDAIGVATTLDIGESGGQYANKVETGKFRVMVAPGDPSVFGNDPDLLLRWFYDGQWPSNYYYWDDTEEAERVLELLDEAAQRSDEAERAELWGEVFDLISEEVPLYPILHRKLTTAWNEEELEGFAPVPTTGLSFLDAGPA
ncbi:ABC transporter substrate-binding protein [Nocardiopsis alkaliphila]|uniref:ABC transporter substrate-binding protein n=1 Tax=Nocardiopsis alkaliphila TaxID=225762 RepID=UPI0003468289|nr:ABC transporter substrate-binding protein [Nocardiopsis alkaliphila]